MWTLNPISSVIGHSGLWISHPTYAKPKPVSRHYGRLNCGVSRQGQAKIKLGTKILMKIFNQFGAFWSKDFIMYSPINVLDFFFRKKGSFKFSVYQFIILSFQFSVYHFIILKKMVSQASNPVSGTAILSIRVISPYCMQAQYVWG